jgi:hypothetical protein
LQPPQQRQQGKGQETGADIASSLMKDAAASTIADDQPKASNVSTPRPWTPNLLVFVVVVSVLSTATANKELLPAPIMTNFPHIRLKLGTGLDNESCPKVSAIIDTATALSTGNFHFVSAIAKKFPHCLAKLYVPEDYNLIILLVFSMVARALLPNLLWVFNSTCPT